MTLVLPPTRRLIALACFTSTCRPAVTAVEAAGETSSAGARRVAGARRATSPGGRRAPAGVLQRHLDGGTTGLDRHRPAVLDDRQGHGAHNAEDDALGLAPGAVEYAEAGQRREADRAWVERVRGADLDAVVEERVVRADANRQLVEELLHGLGARPPGEGAAIDLDDHRHGPPAPDMVAGAEQDVARLPLD